MPYIRTVSEDEATPELKALLEEIRAVTGKQEVQNLYQCASLDVEIARWIWQGSKTVMRRASSLPPRLKELIALAVSERNACQWCVDRHTSMLKTMGFEISMPTSSSEAERDSQISPGERAVLAFAVKLTENAYKVTEKDHETLREEHGFDDQGLLEIVTVASYFNFVNRFVSGLS